MRHNFYLIIFYFLVLNLPNSYSQENSTRLNENWEFLKSDLGGIWEALRPTELGRPESVPLWEEVTLPHTYNRYDAVDPAKNYYQGPAWYRRAIEIENPFDGGRTLLHFEGSAQKTQVYIDTTLVGSHVGGYDEWTVDITEAVREFKKKEELVKRFNGEVPLSIRTDNSRDLEMIPSDMADHNIYGGIHRYLNLVYVPELSVDKVFVTPEVDQTGRKGNLSVDLRWYNPGEVEKSEVEMTLIDPEGEVVKNHKKEVEVLTEDQNMWNMDIRQPSLWSPDDPALYTLKVKITSAAGTHQIDQKIGFRHFEFVKKGPFHLNGERLMLRGTHRHEDHAGVGSAMTEEQIITEIKMMKEIGVNFIRLGHYQQSRIVLDLCDKLGILVWEEIPWNRGGLGGDVYKDQARRMLTNMIEQHYNHPSIIIWGMGNENDWPGDFAEFDREKIRTFMSELNDLSHELDPNRKTAIRRCDFCKDIIDVYSPSIWAGWYRGNYKEYKQVSKAEFEDVDHFLHVEWGGDSHARRHSENPDKILAQVETGEGADERTGDASLYGGSTRVSKDGDWSESYIVNLIDWHLKEQETMDWLTGTAYWPFKDFSTPLRPENPVPYVNQKGIVERDFTRKESFYVFKSYWTEDLMAHIYGRSWPVRWGDKGEQKMIKVYSNADRAELFFNGKSLGVKKRDSQNFPAAGLRWMVTPNAGNNTVEVVAYKDGKQVRDNINFKYQTEKWGEPAKMELEKIKEENGIATVEVKMYDKNEVQVLDAVNYVRFSHVGDGKLLENLGTSTGSSLVQLYNGRAIIRLETKNGKNIVGVSSDGIPSVFLNIKTGANID
ncbi:DUF4982 domain-containing protein [Salegentibacter sp. BDJ18]|uniref:glycoside hydrolase family 2 TIM barrel-domain containing protein n=1 Tax=Salegentibacter sp. BDJ18 TaxID=2816376 RepID=UPI001AAFFCCA|nr:glycoside hydrolase family 2 TIM barrel-domain containing protein [Salegentibacter sp. BDJ18]MBO2543178.1 DUF4982 domain-containing protein [Salegentibacter sp. BDJ18]